MAWFDGTRTRNNPAQNNRSKSGTCVSVSFDKQKQGKRSMRRKGCVCVVLCVFLSFPSFVLVCLQASCIKQSKDFYAQTFPHTHPILGQSCPFSFHFPSSFPAFPPDKKHAYVYAFHSLPPSVLPFMKPFHAAWVSSMTCWSLGGGWREERRSVEKVCALSYSQSHQGQSWS